MWPSIYSSFQTIMVFGLMGMVVKICDDYIDNEIDSSQNLPSFWLHWLGKGVLPYSLFFFALAISIDKPLAVGLFFSCYIVGMFTTKETLFPIGLKGYQEILLVFLIGMFISGTRLFPKLLVLMFNVQLIDDLIDLKRDEGNRTDNLFFLLGSVEGTLVLISVTLINFSIQPVYTFAAAITLITISELSHRLSRRREI